MEMKSGSLLCPVCDRPFTEDLRSQTNRLCPECNNQVYGKSGQVPRSQRPRFGGSYDQANNTIALWCKTCTRTNFSSLGPNGQCGYCYDRKIGWKDWYGEDLAPASRRGPFGNCSICAISFGRLSAKVEVDKTEYCFSCWDELRRTGEVALDRRPVAPELFPQPVKMPALVEMRPKRQIQLED